MKDIRKLSIGGQTIFPLYGASAGLTGYSLIYLYASGDGKMPDFGACEVPTTKEGFKLHDLGDGWLLGVALVLPGGVTLVLPDGLDNPQDRNVIACHDAMVARLQAEPE